MRAGTVSPRAWFRRFADRTVSYRVHAALLLVLASALFAPPGSAPAAAPREDSQGRPAGRYWIFWTPVLEEQAQPASGERVPPAAAAEILSEKARARLVRFGVEPGDAELTNRPVPAEFRRHLSAMGIDVRVESRALRAVSAELTAGQRETLATDPLVARLEPVKSWIRPAPAPPLAGSEGPEDGWGEDPGRLPNGFAGDPAPGAPGASGHAWRQAVEAPDPTSLRSTSYGRSHAQNRQIGVVDLHRLGYAGEGVTICLLDSGYRRAHEAFAFAEVDSAWDFVGQDDQVGHDGSDPDGTTMERHGTYTWSAIAGCAPGRLIGPAYRATYLLGRTEILSREIRLEEDLYVAGLEWADAQGADVVSTSIGYREFLEEGAAYRREDLDGRTAVTSIAAAWLARRGVILVTAVGNEGWSASSLITPADADSIIAVGAVDSLGRVAAFSSRGPTADGRIKPDLCARGVATACAAWPGEDRYTLANGTSLATPLMAGLAALLRQAHPEWGPARVIEALRHAADQREAPDNARGWGVPDGLRAVDSHLGISPELRDPAWTDLQPWIEGAALDHEASPGDSGTVSFWVTNEGSVPTPELRVSLVAQAEILEPGAASANLAPIEPGVMARAVALPARIGARAEPGDSLMALVRFEGADGSFWVRRLRLAITPAQLAVRIFPNPARLGSSLFLDLDAAGPAPWRIDLYDCAGRAVVRWRSEQTGRSGEGGTSAPLRLQMPLPSRLAAGTYFVLATDGSAARRSRVVLLP